MRLAPSADLRCRAVERFGLDPWEGPCAADMASQAVCAAVGAAVGAASVSSQSAVVRCSALACRPPVANRGRAGHGRRGRALLPMHVAGCNVACTMAAPLLLVRFSWPSRVARDPT